MDLDGIRNIGVFKFRNIGDVLMITPALRSLRERFPTARITVGVNSSTDAMLENNPHIDHVLVYDRSLRGARNWFRRLMHELGLCWSVRRARFDLTIDYTSGDRPAWYSLLSGAPRRVSYTWPLLKKPFQRRFYTHLIPDPLGPMHEVERHLFLLEQLGIHTRDTSLCLRTSQAAQSWARDLLAPHRPKKIVHVHPVARWLFKCWDDRKMAAVIDWLEMEKGAKVFLTGDAEEDEIQRTNAILAFCKSRPVVLTGRITLSQLAALSEQSDCFLGVDTAPMHIAAAVGIPVVALFGPSGPATWHPWCERQITLHKPCRCNELRRQDCDWSGVRDCLQAITIDEVKAALDQFI
jgi:heptosyltransferase-3